jgi:hypothetical protein
LNPSSLDVVERFFGESLSQEHVQALEGAPDEQVVDLFERLNDGWLAWFDERFDKGLDPDRHYFLGEADSEVEPLPLEKYKQLALYFPVIATPDPIEALLGSHVLTAQLIGQVTPEAVRADMRVGLARLVQIAPLVRAGAISLVPTVQVLLSEGVQGVARREIEARGSEPEDRTTEAFALATGVCSMAAYWPVASTEPLWRRLQAGGQCLARELGRCNLPVAQAVAEFDVPSIRGLPMRDLLGLRANEASFAEFREAFGVAVRESLDQSRTHGAGFGEQFFRDRLMPHLERCNATAKGTSAFDGMLLPAGAALAVGGLAWLFSTGDNPLASVDNLEKALINTVSPGAAWMAMSFVQRLVAGRHPGRAVYSALLDRSRAI